MLKTTSVDSRGCESVPSSAEVNESGYILLSEDPDAVLYRVYAPLEGFEKHGPWYFKSQYSRREARQARFTVVGLYKDSGLQPWCAPPEYPWMVELPTPAPDQTHWRIYGGSGRPYAIVECP